MVICVGAGSRLSQLFVHYTGFLLGIFFRGEFIVIQISFVMLLFADQISGRGKSVQGGAPCPPPWKKASYIYFIIHLSGSSSQIPLLFRKWSPLIT